MTSNLPPHLRDKLRDAIRARPSPPRKIVRRTKAIALAIALLVSLALTSAIGVNVTHRPAGYVALAGGIWVLVAALGSWWALVPGRSALGRSRPSLLRLSWLVPVSLLAATIGANALWPETWGAPSWSLQPHLGCFVWSVLLAVAPLAAFIHANRASDPVRPAATGAALGAVAGAWAAVAMILHCEMADPLHMGLGHVVPVAVLGAAGALLGARFLRMGART